ncbi:MAG: hypothetical protein ABFC54_04230, partial [Thermoguttaceae bacterium]
MRHTMFLLAAVTVFSGMAWVVWAQGPERRKPPEEPKSEAKRSEDAAAPDRRPEAGPMSRDKGRDREFGPPRRGDGGRREFCPWRGEDRDSEFGPSRRGEGRGPEFGPPNRWDG